MDLGGIHAFFILWSCVDSVIAWRFNEKTSARAKLILSSAGDGIYGLDLKGKVIFANPVAAQTLGSTTGGFISRRRGRPPNWRRRIARIDDFTAMIAHDLRSPLHNIIAVGEMMKEGLFGGLDGEQTKWMGRIVESGHNLVNLVSDFLDVSKLEAGHVDLSKERFDLEPFSKECLENYHIAAQEKKIVLTRSVERSIKPIWADPRRLEQGLNNLISNALKFTPVNRRIDVGAAQDGGGVTLWVKDTGVGIPPEEIDQLFQKYGQTTSGRPPRKRDRPGARELQDDCRSPRRPHPGGEPPCNRSDLSIYAP